MSFRLILAFAVAMGFATPALADAKFEAFIQTLWPRAKAAGISKLFVLTTRTGHWFLKRGFEAAPVDALPRARQNLYNWQRKSQVYVKLLS